MANVGNLTDFAAVRQWIAVGLVASISMSALPAHALDRLRFGTDWLAEADHGGFYQALADGTYKNFGLDVEIVPGGPNAANQTLLIAGKIDIYLGTPQAVITSTLAGVPLVDIAAIYQRAPQVLMAHPKFKSFEGLTELADIFMTAGGYDSYFAWMRATFPGFSEEQYRPYSGSLAPFIANSKSAQQGLLTSEPYSVESQTGWKPTVFLLADYGYSPYAQTITVLPSFIEKQPELIQRFIDASVVGWTTYLYGDRSAGNELIKRENPDMTDELLDFALAAIKEHELVTGGDAVDGGIGCISDSRYEAFYMTLVESGLAPPGFDYRRVFDTRFVCKAKL